MGNLHHALGMGKRHKGLMLLVTSVAAMAVYLLASRNHEPAYNGKTLSQWLESPHGLTPAHAITEIGTNALPFALQWLEYEPSALSKYFLRLEISRRWRWIPVRRIVSDRVDRAECAMLVFEMLGPRAGPAIPRLTKLARNPDSMLSERGCQALGLMGPTAIPTLVQLLADTNAPPDLRSRATCNLGMLFRRAGDHRSSVTNAPSAVSPLIGNLRDADPTVVGSAAAALGFLGLEPERCIPALIETSKHPSPYVHYEANEALKCFGVSVPATNTPAQ